MHASYVFSVYYGSLQLMMLSAHKRNYNPLLMDFDFPRFASVEPRHVCPGIRSLLRQLDVYLEELERSLEPTWEKLMEPLEKMVDRLTVVWGMVNHLKAVKDSEDLRAAMDDVQAVKETGQRFRETILDLGGGKAPLEVFIQFRGREPSPDALLRHNGLLPVAA